MANKDLINKLINEDHPKQVQEQKDESKVPTGTKDEVLITSNRVVSTRYNMYIIFLLLLILVVVYKFLMPSYEKYNEQLESLDKIEQKITTFNEKKAESEANKAMIDYIATNEENIVNCVNEEQGCEGLSEDVINNIDVVRSYVNLNDLNNPKMVIDEKILLTNLNDFLIKNDPLNPSRSSTNGDITKISIGDVEDYNNALNVVPVQLNIVFEDENGLLTFINNIENKILLEAQSRILYYIDNIQYDIVKHEEEQEVNILLYLFYTKA